MSTIIIEKKISGVEEEENTKDEYLETQEQQPYFCFAFLWTQSEGSWTINQQKMMVNSVVRILK